MNTYALVELDGDGELGYHHLIEAAGPMDALDAFYARFPYGEPMPEIAVVMLDSVYARPEVDLK